MAGFVVQAAQWRRRLVLGLLLLAVVCRSSAGGVHEAASSSQQWQVPHTAMCTSPFAGQGSVALPEAHGGTRRQIQRLAGHNRPAARRDRMQRFSGGHARCAGAARGECQAPRRERALQVPGRCGRASQHVQPVCCQLRLQGHCGSLLRDASADGGRQRGAAHQAGPMPGVQLRL